MYIYIYIYIHTYIHTYIHRYIGFKIYGLEVGAWGLEFTIQGVGFRVQIRL
jgi:hypothetical protein